MHSRYIYFVKNLKSAICERPELLEDYPYLDALFEATSYPLLPDLMQADVRQRRNHSYAFEQLNQRFTEYRNLAASLQFILDGYLFYKELACLGTPHQELQLRGYAQDLAGVEQQLNQMLKVAEECRKSPYSCRFLAHYYFPKTVPPASIPVISGAFFCEPLPCLKNSESTTVLTPEWVQYN